MRVGFEAPADYVKATQRLLDAYVFMDNEKENVRAIWLFNAALVNDRALF